MQQTQSALCIGLFCTTTKENYRKQIIECRNTWVKDCESLGIIVKFFGGYHDDQEVKVINLPATGEDYSSITNKQFKMMYYMTQHYPSKYYLLTGTDNYYVGKQLLNIISNFDDAKNYYAGGKGENRVIQGKTIYFHSGGGGLILSHNLMLALINILNIKEDYNSHILSFHEKWKLIAPDWLHVASDVALAYYIETLFPDTIIEIVPQMQGCSFLTTAINDTVKCWMCNGNKWDDIASCHYMESGHIRHFHQYLHGKNIKYNNPKWLIIAKVNDVSNHDFIFNCGAVVHCCSADYNIDFIKNIINTKDYQYYMWINFTGGLITHQDIPQIQNIMKLKKKKINLCYQKYSRAKNNARICNDFITGAKEYWLQLQSDDFHTLIEEGSPLINLYYADQLGVIINYDHLKVENNKIATEFVSAARNESSHQLCYNAAKDLSTDLYSGYATLSMEEHLTFIDDYYIACFYLQKYVECWEVLKMFDQLYDNYKDKFNQFFKIQHMINNTDHMLNHIKQPIIIIEGNNVDTGKFVECFIKDGYKVFIFGNYEVTYDSLLHRNPVIRPFHARSQLNISSFKHIIKL